MTTLQNDIEHNNYKRSKAKRSSFQNKNDNFNLNFIKNFEKVQKPKKQRYYSTKLAVSFVPTLKPKKSFRKPTFLQLDETEAKNENKENEKSFELEKISSCDENEDGDSSNLSSSDIESNKEEEKNNYEVENKNNSNLYKNKPNLDNKVNKEDKEEPPIKESSEDEDENEDEDHNENERKKSSMKNLRKEMLKIKNNSVLNKSKEMGDVIPNNLISEFILENQGNKNDLVQEEKNNRDKEFDSDSNSNFIKQDNFIKSFSILDIISFKNKKK